MKGRVVAADAIVVAKLAAAAAPSADVTLGVDRFYDAPNRIWRLRFSGTIASGAANESVVVMGQKCGLDFATSARGLTLRVFVPAKSAPCYAAGVSKTWTS